MMNNLTYRTFSDATYLFRRDKKFTNEYVCLSLACNHTLILQLIQTQHSKFNACHQS